MKNYIFGLSILSSLCFGCSTSQDNQPTSFSLEVQDSISIDYLKPRYLIDYDPIQGKYLLSNESYYQYLEVNESGEIIREDSIPWDGPNAVSVILGMGYSKGKLALATQTDGFKFYENGQPLGKLKIPYPYTSFSFLPELSLLAWNGGYLFPRFMAESELAGGFTEEFYRNTYANPLFSFLKEGDSIRHLVLLPKESRFLNGQYHGGLTLVPRLQGEDLYVLTWVRPEILHYKAEGDEFIYQRTITLDLKNWVGYDEVPMNQAESFYDNFRKKMPGTVRGIYPVGDYFLIQYQNGISEDLFPQAKTESGNFDSEKINELNPPLLAVLDKDLNVLATGLELPKGVNGQLVVNKQGKLVGLKNPALSSTEDSFLILYQMDLNAN